MKQTSIILFLQSLSMVIILIQNNIIFIIKGIDKNKNPCYLCGEKEKQLKMGKEINWLFPDANAKVSLEDYQKKIFEDEHSGDISFRKFKERLEIWWKQTSQSYHTKYKD